MFPIQLLAPPISLSTILPVAAVPKVLVDKSRYYTCSAEWLRWCRTGSRSANSQIKNKASQINKQLFLKSIDKSFPHPVGVFRTHIDNLKPPFWFAMQQIISYMLFLSISDNSPICSLSSYWRRRFPYQQYCHRQQCQRWGCSTKQARR